jgi:hypothetical protein
MTISEKLVKYKLLESNKNLTAQVFENIFQDIFEISYTSCSTFITSMYRKYEEMRDSKPNRNEDADRSVNGKVFELLIAVLLIREKIIPFHYQSEITLAPHIKFDIVLYNTGKGLITLSLKTSFRERWKQAELEASMVKQAHKKSLNYLIVYKNDRKTEEELYGLTAVIETKTKEFDELFSKLKGLDFVENPEIKVISKYQGIINSVDDD